MNIAWSPVATPDQRERAFINAAITRKSRGLPTMRTSKRPPDGEAASQRLLDQGIGVGR